MTQADVKLEQSALHRDGYCETTYNVILCHFETNIWIYMSINSQFAIFELKKVQTSSFQFILRGVTSL